MKKINTDLSVFESINHKKKDKANEMFLKFYAKIRGKTILWNVVRYRDFNPRRKISYKN